MTCDQITGAVVEDLKIANEIARVFIESGKPYTVSNLNSRCYSTAFNFARDHLVSRCIQVDDDLTGMEMAEEKTYDFLAMANTIVRNHYATR